MEQKRLNLYTVNMKYIRDLHNQGDDRVFSVSPQVGKDSRPFLVKKSRKALQNGGKEERERSIKAALPEMEQAGADTRTVLKLMFIGQLMLSMDFSIPDFWSTAVKTILY